MSDPVDVAFCFDDNLALPGAVAILSLLASAKAPVRLHVLTDPASRAAPLLEALAARYGAALNIVDEAPEAGHAFDAASAYAWASTATYRRVFLAERLTSVDRVLYLDADTLTYGDLGELWGADLGGWPLGAVQDQWAITSAPLRAEFPGGYFNAGVMLLDLTRWRAEGLTGKVVAEIDRRQREALAAGGDARRFLNEQTPMNAVIAGRWRRLSPRWNCSTFLTPRIGDALGLPVGAVAQITADPGIVHFLGGAKPWLSDFIALTPWHAAFNTWRAALERDFDLGGLAWPGAFTNGADGARRRRLIAMQLVRRAQAEGFEQSVVVLTGLLAGEIVAVAREQGLVIAGIASESPVIAGGRLRGMPVMGLGEAVDQGHTNFILGDYRQPAQTRAAVEHAAASRNARLRILGVDSPVTEGATA